MLSWLSRQQPQASTPILETRATSPFYAVDGSLYSTLHDFAEALIHMSNETFSHHVTDQKNDFASWIEGCFTGPAKQLGNGIRGKNREEMIRYFMQGPSAQKTISESGIEKTKAPVIPPTPLTAAALPKTLPPTTMPERTKPAGTVLPSLPGRAEHPPQSAAMHAVLAAHAAIRDAPTHATAHHLATSPPEHVKHHIIAPHHNPKQVHAHQDEHIELHPKALPPSPLQHIHTQRIKAVHDKLGEIRLEAVTDQIQAKESFIVLRTHVWRDLDENERRAVLPELRDVYECLLNHR